MFTVAYRSPAKVYSKVCLLTVELQWLSLLITMNQDIYPSRLDSHRATVSAETPDCPILSRLLQLIWWDPEVSLGHLRDLVLSRSPGFSPVCPHEWNIPGIPMLGVVQDTSQTPSASVVIKIFILPKGQVIVTPQRMWSSTFEPSSHEGIVRSCGANEYS